MQSPESDLPESLVGKSISISPNKLLNQGRLFTTQGGIDDKKLKAAVLGEDVPPEHPPSADLWIPEPDVPYRFIIGDGNHRVAVSCLRKVPIDIFIRDIIKGVPKVKLIGFNAIVNKVRNEISSVGDLGLL